MNIEHNWHAPFWQPTSESKYLVLGDLFFVWIAAKSSRVELKV